MAKFAFRSEDPDEMAIPSRHHADKLRKALRTAGHDARREGKGDEHYVYINHPTDKGAIAYVSREEAPRLVSHDWKPHWVDKR